MKGLQNGTIVIFLQAHISPKTPIYIIYGFKFEGSGQKKSNFTKFLLCFLNAS